MKRLVDAIRNIIFLAAVCVIICAVLCVVLQIKPAVVVSGSMEPALHTGSVVFIDKKKIEPEVGEIVAFERGGVFITHRVAEKTKDGYVTKGDANKTNDSGILKAEAVIGTTEYSVPYIGYIIKLLAEPAGIIMSVSICICGMLASKLCYEE